MFRKLINTFKELFGSRESDSGKQAGVSDWEKRKAELIEKAREGDLPAQKHQKKKPDRNRYKENQRRTRQEKKEDFSDKPVKKEKDGKPEEDKSERKEKPSGREKRRPGPQRRNKERPPKEEIQAKDYEETETESTIPEIKWDPSEFEVEPEEGKVRFHDFDLPQEVMRAIHELGFRYCTPIQAEVLGKTLEGKDAVGQAQTGTGKTAAFLITAFTRHLAHKPRGRRAVSAPRTLIIAPTRELVLQIEKDANELGKYTGLNVVSVYGGMDFRRQQRKLHEKPVDLLIATPGRLIDFHNRGEVNLGKVEILIIDEADRMLDMGFIPDVRKIVRATPFKEQRQTLLFSATITEDVKRLAASWTTDSITVSIQPQSVAAETVDQKVYIVTADEKFKMVYNIIVKKNLNRVIIFANRKDEAGKLENMLYRHGFNSALLTGDVPQKKRIRTLDDFKAGKINFLIATDVAGRGLHIEGISHVINFNLPEDPEDYIHRIGRTGRAGASGTSVSFASEDDSFHIPKIEEMLGNSLECEFPPEELLEEPPAYKQEPRKAQSQDKVKKFSRPHRSRRPGPPRGKRSGGGNAQSGNKPPEV